MIQSTGNVIASVIRSVWQLVVNGYRWVTGSIHGKVAANEIAALSQVQAELDCVMANSVKVARHHQAEVDAHLLALDANRAHIHHMEHQLSELDGIVSSMATEACDTQAELDSVHDELMGHRQLLADYDQLLAVNGKLTQERDRLSKKLSRLTGKPTKVAIDYPAEIAALLDGDADMSKAEVARQLGCSPKTVAAHWPTSGDDGQSEHDDSSVTAPESQGEHQPS